MKSKTISGSQNQLVLDFEPGITERHDSARDVIATGVYQRGLDAIRLCIQLSGYTHERLAEKLGIDKGHFSRIMQGKAWFPDTKRIDLMDLCGNRAPAQYDALMTGCDLVEKSKDAKIRELEEQLKQLRAA